MDTSDENQHAVTLLKRLWSFLRKEQEESATTKEIEKILDEVEEKGIIDEDQGDMIHNILVLKDTTVSEIMVPKGDMVALECSSSLDDLVELIQKEGCSRIPIYEENLDNIIGIVYAKDVLKYWKSSDEISEIKELMHPPYFIPEGKKLIDLLKEFRQKRNKMAIIIDEYGTVDGLVTIGDIIEEIVGDMIGEDDEYVEEDIVHKGDGIYYVDPKMPIDEFSEIFNANIPEGNYDTVAGFITFQMERIPQAGEILEYGDITFEIVGADKKRIYKLIVHSHARKKT
ncbi:MAG: hemolysin family protein [Desulfomonilia bacterium]